MTEVNGVAVFGAPKTHQHRTVPVPAFLRDLLAVQLAGAHPEDFVFPAPCGGVLRVNNFRRRRRRFVEAATDVGLGGSSPTSSVTRRRRSRSRRARP